MENHTAITDYAHLYATRLSNNTPFLQSDLNAIKYLKIKNPLIYQGVGYLAGAMIVLKRYEIIPTQW